MTQIRAWYNLNTLHPPSAPPTDEFMLLSHLDSYILEDATGLYNLEDNSGHYVLESDTGNLGNILQSNGDKLIITTGFTTRITEVSETRRLEDGDQRITE